MITEAWAPVCDLLFLSRPPAILRRVRTIVVDAIDAMAWTRTLAHVLNKLRVIVPAFTDGNSAPSVVRVANRLRIPAARAHHQPGVIRAAVRFAVRVVDFRDGLVSRAPATLSDAAPKGARRWSADDRAAIAVAGPAAFVVRVIRSAGYNEEPTESQAGQVRFILRATAAARRVVAGRQRAAPHDRFDATIASAQPRSYSISSDRLRHRDESPKSLVCGYAHRPIITAGSMKR